MPDNFMFARERATAASDVVIDQEDRLDVGSTYIKAHIAICDVWTKLEFVSCRTAILDQCMCSE